MSRPKQVVALGAIVAAVAAYRRLRAASNDEANEQPMEELTDDRSPGT